MKRQTNPCREISIDIEKDLNYNIKEQIKDYLAEEMRKGIDQDIIDNLFSDKRKKRKHVQASKQTGRVLVDRLNGIS